MAYRRRPPLPVIYAMMMLPNKVNNISEPTPVLRSSRVEVPLGNVKLLGHPLTRLGPR